MPFQRLPLGARTTAWFLFLSYLLGGPVFVALEFFSSMLSERFVYAPAFIYLVGIVQLGCSVLLLYPRTRFWSLVILTVISVGAVGSHFRIGSPLTAIPALVYTVLQMWLALYAYQAGHGRSRG